MRMLDGPFVETKELVLAPRLSVDVGRYAFVNGLCMYYEVHGRGRPLVLLHSSMNTIDSTFGQVVRALACTRQVIAVEQQAHGRTHDIARALSYEQMADDTAELMRQLRLAPVDVFAYSMGAAVGLQLAARHPYVVNKLILVSGAYDAEGFMPDVLELFRGLKPDDPVWTPPSRAAFERVGAGPERFACALDRVREALFASRALPHEQLRKVRAETLLIGGTSGMVLLEHLQTVSKILPHARLEVVPGFDHDPAIVGRSAMMVPEFLDAALSVRG